MKNKGVIQILIGASLFGLIPLFVKSSAGLGVLSIAFGRALFATTYSKSILLIRKQALVWPSFFSRINFHFMVWTGLLLGAMLCYFLSIQYGKMSLAGMFMGLHPFFVLFFSYLFFKERISKITLLSCLVAFIGLLFVIGFEPISYRQGLSCLFGMASAFFLGLNFIYHLKFLKGYNSNQLVFFQSLYQIPILLPFLFLEEFSFSIEALFSVVMLGVICSGLAYSLIYAGSMLVQKQQIGLLQMVENVIPLLIGVFFFGEDLSFYVVIGVVLLFLSVGLILFDKN
jgi:drug/metabolite transporter (DMT)-like permease